MIEPVIVDGRYGWRSFLDSKFQPVDDEATATLVKIVFDDGKEPGQLILQAQPPAAAKAFRGFDPDEPRDESGKWSSGGGDGGDSKPSTGSAGAKATVGKFVKEHVKGAVNTVGQKLKDNQRELLGAAVAGSLYHLAGIDFPEDVAEAIRDQVAHFADNAGVGVAMARNLMGQVADKLTELRRTGKAIGDDPVLKALLGFKKLLGKDELFKDEPKKEFDESQHPRDESGKFSESGGGGGGSEKPAGSKAGKLANFLNDHAKQAIEKVAHGLKANQKTILATALAVSLNHVLDAELPYDVHEQIHHQVEHFSETAQISMLMARSYMREVVNNLLAVRQAQGKRADEEDVGRDGQLNKPPRPADQTKPAVPGRAGPCHAQPRRARPCLAEPRLPYQAMPANVGAGRIVSGDSAGKDFDEAQHPRDPGGKFTESGGSDGDGDKEHPGEGYSKDAYVQNGTIHTASVYDAQRALFENKKVELKQPKQISTLIKLLGETTRKMVKAGKEAPNFNLCNATVKGTNLFCADTKGIPRIKMPQLDDQQTKDFRKYLEKQGYSVTKEKTHASHLRATQNELIGAKVAKIAGKLSKEPDHQGDKRLVVSNDDYILDGHHHWAAKLALDAADNNLTNDTKMKIARVDIPIIRLLEEAERFTGGKGHKPGSESTTGGKSDRRGDFSEPPRLPDQAEPAMPSIASPGRVSPRLASLGLAGARLAMPTNGPAVGNSQHSLENKNVASGRTRDVEGLKMPIAPGKEESESTWMARCVPDMMGEGGGTRRPQEQAVAACAQMWRDSHRGQKQNESYVDPEDINAPSPDDGEDREDFLDRCTDELMSDNEDLDEDTAQNACQLAWENRKANDIIRKTHSEIVHGSEYVLSDDSIDRMGDSIHTSGWDLSEFTNEKNPIALFNHNSNFIIGRWQDVRVEKNTLRGRLVLATKDTSARVREIHKLIEQGILKAVSVGFRDLQSEPLKTADGRALGGLRYLRPHLVEASLVAVPANPNALAIAKSLDISPRMLDQIFAKHGRGKSVQRRGFTGKLAKSHYTNGKGAAMSSLAHRITTLEEQLRNHKDALQAHLENLDDTDVSDAEYLQTKEYNLKIEQIEKQRAALIESEKLLAKTADNGTASVGSGRSLAVAGSNREAPPPQLRKKQQEKELGVLDYLARTAVVAYFQKNTGRLTDEVREKIYPGDEVTKESCNLVLRAPSAPALTTVTGWAAELVHQIYTDFMDLLLPSSILPRLASYGMTLNFGAAGRIIIPTRSRTPTLAGSFVGEGMAIPVRQGMFTSQTLTPKKVAVISTWTREMNDHSIPAIEGLLREAVQVDTSIAIDSVLLDNNPATTIRPAGLLNGLTPLTGTAGGGLAALTGDLKQMGQALVAGTYGNVRKPVWLINPGMLYAASLTAAANTGIFPFRDEIKQGTLNNIPFIASTTVAIGTMTMIDAADFVVVGGEAPRLELSDQATLHMEDTNPTDLVSTGSPGVVAAPQRSLFQTDSIALRMVMPLNWLQRRAGTIVTLTGTTWN
jgi:HK97 family phage major capsid protein/HK97 family phage prohead protease